MRRSEEEALESDGVLAPGCFFQYCLDTENSQRYSRDLCNHNTQHVTTSSNNNDDMNWTALNQAPPQNQYRCYERPFLKNLARTTSPLPLSVQSSCPLHARDSCFASFLPWPFVESELVVRNDHRHWTSRSRRRIRKWQTSSRNRIQTETIRCRQTLLRLLAADAVSCVRYCFRRQCQWASGEVKKSEHTLVLTYASIRLARFRFNNSCAVRIAELCCEWFDARDVSDLGEMTISGDWIGLNWSSLEGGSFSVLLYSSRSGDR